MNCPMCATEMENKLVAIGEPWEHACPSCSFAGDTACVEAVAKMRVRVEILERAIRRLACGDYFVAEDGRTLACGLADWHQGACAEHECSWVLEELDSAEPGEARRGT